MFSVDKKKKLASCLRHQLPFDRGNKLHCWGQGLQDDQIIQALCLRGIGSVPIPVSCQNILKLIGGVTSSDVATNLCDNPQPSVSSMLTINLANGAQSLLLEKAVLAVKNIADVNLNGEMTIRLNQLSICTPKGQHHRKTSNLKKPGTFGKFIVQIPVEGGYVGGRLKLRKAEKDVTCFDFDDQSNRLFYVAAFFSDLKHEWLPVQRGSMVALEYDLLWQPTPGFVTSPIDRPAFFVALQSAKEILGSWDQSAKRVEDGATNPEQLISAKVPPEFSRDSAKPGFTPDASRDHLLIIPLTGTYYETNFSFTSLHGSDRPMAHILQSIDFIDVHLAVVSQSLETENPTVPRGLQVNCVPSTKSFLITNWIYSSISLPQFREYHLDLANQLIGELVTNLVSKGNTEQMSRHAVIVIQPRHQSIRRCCASHFDAMLDYLESRISSDADSKMSRLHTTICLGQTISFCKEEPLKVWDVPADIAAGRTLRLFNICRELKAEEEILSLVKLLGQDFTKQANNEKTLAEDSSANDKSSVFYEGIRNEGVARCIVETLIDAGGWHKFTPSILGLISPNRLQEQLKNFACMILVLLENRWVPEATDVAQQIISAVSANFDVLKDIGQPQIDAYFNAIMALEAVVGSIKESVLTRLVVPVFSKLGFGQQCSLLINLKKQNSSMLQGSSTCLEMYEQMCLMFLRRGLCNSGRIAAVVADVVSCFVKLGNKSILQTFIDQVLWHRRYTGSEINNFLWLEELVTAALLSNVAKDVLTECLNKRVDVFKTIALEPPGRDEEIRRDQIIRFFLVIFRLERTPQLALDARMHLVVQTVVSTMPYHRLVNLATDLVEKGSVRLKEHHSGKRMLLHLAYLLLDRDCSLSDCEPPINPIVEILKCLLAFSEDGFVSAKKLIQFVSRCDKWSLSNRNLIIKTIFSSSVMWNDYGKAETAVIARQCLRELMTSWITGLVRMFDAPIDVNSAAEKHCLLRTNTAVCFLCYIREQKKHLTFDDVVVDPFSRLLSRMTPHQLANLIWDVYKADANELPNLKKFPGTLKLYTDLCRRFIGRNDASFFQYWKTSSVTGNMLIETATCLLWLGDEQCITDLAVRLSTLYPDEPNDAILQLVKTAEVRHLADSLPQIRDSFCRLLSHRVGYLAEKLARERPPAWKMPSASLPDHPVVEQFLHSTAQQMTYSNFINKKQALDFERRLISLESINGYSLRATVSGQHFNSKCQIVKVKTMLKKVQTTKAVLLEEKTNLENIISSLEQHKRNASGSQAEFIVGNIVDDEIVVLDTPAVKKKKMDIHVIDITD